MEALQPPVLEALPFRLRPWSPADVPVVMAASGDRLIPLITTVPASGTESAALAFIERQRRRLSEGSGFSFAIADAASNNAVGQIGLGLKNHQHGRAGIGYWIAPGHRGRGAASSALGAVSAWALQQPGIHRLELHVEPWNEASWRTAERSGFAREGLLRSWQDVGGERKDMYVYSRLRLP